MRVIEVDQDDIVIIRRGGVGSRRDLYGRLDLAQQRAQLAAAWVMNCPCNPANGGSGMCGCVNPYQGTYCGVTTQESTLGQLEDPSCSPILTC